MKVFGKGQKHGVLGVLGAAVEEDLRDHPVDAVREHGQRHMRRAGKLARQLGGHRAREHGAQVINLPCVGMLPPSFVDFALSRGYADGVMITGCPEGDCPLADLPRGGGERAP